MRSCFPKKNIQGFIINVIHSRSRRPIIRGSYTSTILNLSNHPWQAAILKQAVRLKSQEPAVSLEQKHD
jgi:hypothetical protein